MDRPKISRCEPVAASVFTKSLMPFLRIELSDESSSSDTAHILPAVLGTDPFDEEILQPIHCEAVRSRPSATFLVLEGLEVPRLSDS